MNEQQLFASVVGIMLVVCAVLWSAIAVLGKHNKRAALTILCKAHFYGAILIVLIYGAVWMILKYCDGTLEAASAFGQTWLLLIAVVLWLFVSGMIGIIAPAEKKRGSNSTKI